MEPSNNTTQPGRIELICGPMFSGKTEALLRRLAEARARAVPTATFKHACDDRYHDQELVAHNGGRMPALAAGSAAQIADAAGAARLIVIDEAQFFGIDLVEVCTALRARGSDVLVAGLDLDSWGEPFGPVPYIERIADRVTRLTGTCAICHGAADHTQRIAPIDGLVMVGGPEAYESRCAKCFEAPPAHLRR